MPSIGELFVELGVVGDVKPLEKAIGTMKEAVKQIDNEIKANQRLLKYLQDIKNARNASEKALIKQNFAKEIQKQKMLDEIDSNQKAVDGKKELASKIAGVVKDVGLFVGALTGAAVALNNLTNSLVESNQAMLDLTRTTDIAQSTFQKWGGIGKMLGVENADQQLASLNQRLFDLMLTGEGARGFQLAGINPMGQDAEDVLEQLRARVSRMNDTTATYLLQQMGLDPKMLYLLRIGRKEFEALGRTIDKYRLSDDQTKEIQRMNIQLQIAGIKLRYLKDRALLELMPYWVKLVQSFARVAEMLAKVGKKVGEFVVKWRGLIAGAVLFLSRFKPVAEFLTKTSLIFKEMGASVSKLILKIPVLGRFLGVLGGIAAKALLPFTALFLLLDDFAVFSQGGNSVTGEVLKWFEETGEDFSKIFDKMFGGDFIGGLQETFIKIVDVLDDFVQVLLRIGEILTGLPLTKWGKNFANWASQGAYDDLKNYEYGRATGGAAPLLGYSGALPNLDKMFVTPAMQRNLSYSTNNTSNTDNRQINQNISIQSSQPVFDIQNQLAFARNAITSGW